MIHVGNAAAAIGSGLCETVLLPIWRERPLRRRAHPQCRRTTSLAGRYEQPYGPMGRPTLFTIPVLSSMKTYVLSHERLLMVAVVQREWAAKNPRVIFGRPALVGRPGVTSTTLIYCAGHFGQAILTQTLV
jgi:hypothetical protein